MEVNNCWVNPLVEEGMAHVMQYFDTFEFQDFICIIRTEKFDLTDEEGFAKWKRERLYPDKPLTKKLGYGKPNGPAVFESGMKHLSEIYDNNKIQELIDTMRNDHFDYTEWRRDNLYKGMSLDEILNAAAEHERSHGAPKIRGPLTNT
jgi:hypothetical protein